MKTYGIIHIPTDKVEEFREADNAADALTDFLEVSSYVSSQYKAEDATHLSKNERYTFRKWDGGSFVLSLIEEGFLDDDIDGDPIIKSIVDELADLKGVTPTAMKQSMRNRLRQP